MIPMIDLQKMKDRLAEYNPDVQRCSKKVAEYRNYAPDYVSCEEWDSYTVTYYSPCCRPEGHEGECRNSRRIMGWPGYQAVKDMIQILENLTPVWVLHNPYPDKTWRGMEKCLGSEDADVLIFYSKEAAEVYRTKMGVHHFYSTQVYMTSPSIGEAIMTLL